MDFIFKKSNHKLKDFLNRDAVILDVRTQKEYNTGHIVNSMHIPLQELSENIGEIVSKNKPVVAYCQSGTRSAKAVSVLEANGIEAINGGGMDSLKRLMG